VLFFISLATRRIEYAACSSNPHGPWAAQQARNLTTPSPPTAPAQRPRSNAVEYARRSPPSRSDRRIHPRIRSRLSLRTLRPPRIAHSPGRQPSAARRAGPQALGSRLDRRRTVDRPPLHPPQPTRPLPAAGRDQRRARRRANTPRHRLAADPRPLRPPPSDRPHAGRCPQPRHRDRRGSGRHGSARPGRRNYWTWTTTNPSTPPEPICSGGSAETAAAAYERAAAMAPTDAERDFLRLGGRASR
jgi:hypothetical protein